VTAARTLPAITLGARYNGPPDSANGGYACGRVAALVDGPAAVRLSSPPALDHPLAAHRTDDGGVRVTHDGVLVADGRPLGAGLPDDVPVVPSYADCLLARERHPGRGVRHLLSDCYVCGPERTDGLGVTPGPLAGSAGVLAAPYLAPTAEADGDGLVPEALTWAALDCPSYPAALIGTGAIALLGELAADVRRPVRADERMCVVGWTLGVSGRKHRTASAVLSPDGELVAVARATWIELR
jgi:hypothetical protein